MHRRMKLLITIFVAPLIGAGIEMHRRMKLLITIFVAPLIGAGIEMWMDYNRRWERWSHLL
ncbi:hypothetical protein COM83_02870 [Bacillus cereus]|nr:hypothetical protein COM83_02870 [Bacillus cereus]PFW09517.1 hypothetical protein COL18_25215 [Bacillus cereus]PGX01741.1 hypothetical protein COE40_18625 [Bacillus cereus]PGY19808.1 hypothetical protein COE16_16490 [Bacillus cereus]